MSEKFWSNPTVEPKRAFRWLFSLAGANSLLETYAIKSCKKPSFAVSEIPHQFVAHTFYYPGRITWNTVDVTFVDPVSPDQSAIITNMIVEAGYQAPKDQERALTSLSKGGFWGAIGEPVIMQLDAAGKTLEEWTLHNSFFTSVDFGQLDYGTEDLLINSVTIRYDYATFNTIGSSPASTLTP